MGAGYHGGFGNSNGTKNHLKSDLIAELEKNKIKFTKEDIVFITKDKSGQVVWLEKGNSGAGLKHILDGDGNSPGHKTHFEKAFGINASQIPSFLNKVISEGEIVANNMKIRNGHPGFERIYYYNGKHYLLAGIGTNGFIVSAYPIEYYGG